MLLYSFYYSQGFISFNTCYRVLNYSCHHYIFIASLVILNKSKYLGAIESAKKYKCTPKQALGCKEFFAGY